MPTGKLPARQASLKQPPTAAEQNGLGPCQFTSLGDPIRESKIVEVLVIELTSREPHLDGRDRTGRTGLFFSPTTPKVIPAAFAHSSKFQNDWSRGRKKELVRQEKGPGYFRKESKRMPRAGLLVPALIYF